MLWLAHQTRHRFTLQIRSGGQKLQVWDTSTGRWNDESLVAGSSTAILRLERGGQKLDFRSRSGYSQRLLFFDARGGRSIGTIEVNASGAFMIRKGVEGASIVRNWPALWTTQTVAIIRVQPPIEIFVTDRQGGGEGTITYEAHHTTWHVPGSFWERTRNYDIGDDRDDVRTDPVGLPPAFGQILGIVGHVPTSNATTTAPSTPHRQRRTTSRAVSIASQASTQVAPIQSGNNDEEGEHRDMPTLIDIRTQNNSVGGTTTQKDSSLGQFDVYEYASTSGLQVNQPSQQPQVEGVGVDFSKWWSKDERTPLSNERQEDQSLKPTNTEASTFRVEKKLDGKEGLFDNIGEIQWIIDEDMRGAHYTVKLHRAYRHISGYCPHCMQ